MSKKYRVEKDLFIVANQLDEAGLHKEADIITNVLKRFAAAGVAAYDETSGIPYEVYEQNQSLAQEIARQIQKIKEETEAEQWVQEDFELDYADNESGTRNFNRNLKSRTREFQKNHLLQELARIGGKLQRPYEHWNEDEQHMALQEADRDF